MTKEAWITHMEEASGLTRPSKAPWNKEDWQSTIKLHHAQGCPECAARMKTKKRSASARAKEDAYRSAGLTKVIGSVSGSVYWE